MRFLDLTQHASQAATVSATPLEQVLLASRISDTRSWLQAFPYAVASFLAVDVVTDFASGALWNRARRIGAGLAHQWSFVGLLSPMFHKEVIEALCVVFTAGLTLERLCVYYNPITICVTTFRDDVSILRFAWHVYV